MKMVDVIASRETKAVRLHGLVCFFVVCVAAIAFLAGCAGRAYLMVDYSVPQASRQLQDVQVRIDVKDMRPQKRVLMPRAKYHFQGFQGRYSLAWVRPDNERILAGEHDLQNLFRAVFSKRLEQFGADITDGQRDQVPLFTVVLKEFNIDYQDRKWLAKVSYETDLTLDQKLLARKTVSGNAERVRIIGRKGADVVLSEIFTDIVNRLDVVDLFQKADLIN